MRRKLFLTALLAYAVCTFAGDPARAATPQPIPAGAAVTLSAPGLYDISTADHNAVVTITVNGVALTGTTTTTKRLSVVINGVTLTLKDATIVASSTSPSGSPAIKAVGACGLVLIGDNSATVQVTSNVAGVNVPAGASLTIEGPGTLTATGGQYGGAGIGGIGGVGGPGESSGAITIRHVTIVATGGGAGGGQGGGAGIGGGGSRSGVGGESGVIAIVNSSVKAIGGKGINRGGGGAGIGGGGSYQNSDGGAGKNITITNSVVEAQGGGGGGCAGGGAGIGGGGGGDGGAGTDAGAGGAGSNITINTNSAVKAIGGAGSALSTANGGGGGAAVGGGGGGAVNGAGSNGAGGTASSITIVGNQLAVGSAGSAGGVASFPGTSGGAGALCGNGGAGGNTTSGAEVTLVGGGTASDTGPAVNLSSHPETSDPGYPLLPSVTNPSDRSITAGNDTTFTVTASGGIVPYSYQWQIDNSGWTDIANGGIYSGAATASLTLAGVPIVSNGNQFRCVVTDANWHDAISAAATLTVDEAPGGCNAGLFGYLALALIAGLRTIRRR